MIDAARNTQELPRLVGYAELSKVYGWQKRSLQRAVAAGKLRRPMIVAGGRAAWYDTDIKDYLARLGGELEAIAVSDPDKLLPEQIEDAAAKLSARLMANVLGEVVSPDDVVIGAVKQLSPDDAETVGYTRWLALWLAIEEHMSTLDHLQSMAAAYGLFPAMRPWLDDIANRGGIAFAHPACRHWIWLSAYWPAGIGMRSETGRKGTRSNSHLRTTAPPASSEQAACRRSGAVRESAPRPQAASRPRARPPREGEV